MKKACTDLMKFLQIFSRCLAILALLTQCTEDSGTDAISSEDFGPLEAKMSRYSGKYRRHLISQHCPFLNQSLTLRCDKHISLAPQVLLEPGHFTFKGEFLGADVDYFLVDKNGTSVMVSTKHPTRKLAYLDGPHHMNILAGAHRSWKELQKKESDGSRITKEFLDVYCEHLRPKMGGPPLPTLVIEYQYRAYYKLNHLDLKVKKRVRNLISSRSKGDHKLQFSTITETLDERTSHSTQYCSLEGTL